jgi:hypothetical protein
VEYWKAGHQWHLVACCPVFRQDAAFGVWYRLEGDELGWPETVCEYCLEHQPMNGDDEDVIKPDE